MNEVDSKTGMKFWIAALAFSMLLMATTFALLATYLAEIKANTSAAIARADLVASRLNTLDTELAFLHRHILEQKSVVVVAPTESVAPTVSEGSDKPAVASPELPAIQPPTLSPSAATPPAVGPAPAPTPAPAKP